MDELDALDARPPTFLQRMTVLELAEFFELIREVAPFDQAAQLDVAAELSRRVRPLEQSKGDES